MKGVVFNQLQEFVERQAGFTLWDEAIESLELPSNGVYVSTQSYGDTELMALVGFLSGKLNVAENALVKLFGEFLFSRLMPLAPSQARQAKSLAEFLKLVEDIIHVEVLKLYKDANLPTFDYKEDVADQMTMVYRSPRKLCYLSEGLITGAAKHFEQEIRIKQPQCMHNGAECCHIEIEFL